jgi:hypothetical protein
MAARTKAGKTELLQALAEILEHDLRKPETNVKMFFEVLKENADDPGQMEFWRKHVLSSFEACGEILRELSVLSQKSLREPGPVKLAELLSDAYRAEGCEGLAVWGEKELLGKFFLRFRTAVGRLRSPILVRPSTTARAGGRVSLLLTPEASGPGGGAPRASTKAWAEALCGHILRLHGTSLTSVGPKRSPKGYRVSFRAAPRS